VRNRFGRWAGWIGLVVAALVFVFVWFGPAVDRAYIHYVRTPVTVTLQANCAGPGTLTPWLACYATWTVDGKEHKGWVLRKETGAKGETFDGAVVRDDYVIPDRGVFAVHAVALAGGLAPLVLIPAALLMRRQRAARHGRHLPLLTVALSPLITLGVVTAGIGLILLAALLDQPQPDPGQAGHGAIAIGAGAVLILAGVPVWRPIVRQAIERDNARIAALRERAAAERAAGPVSEPAAADPVSVPAAPPAPPRLWWNDETLTSVTVTDMLRLAAGEMPPGSAMTTGRLLDAVARMDLSGDWQRVWLVVGDPHRLRLATASDSSGPAPGPIPDAHSRTWAGVPLTARLTQSLWLADRIAGAYRLRPVPAGVVALALLAHHGNGATDALLSGSGTSHPQLLATVQSDILRMSLPGLSRYIPDAP